MTDASTESVWRLAAEFDPALRIKPTILRALADKHVALGAWSRETMFRAVAAGRPVVLSGVGVPVVGSAPDGVELALLRLLKQAFSGRTTNEGFVRAQVGPSRTRRRLSVAELVRRWQSGRHVVSVTDLHIRGTQLERGIHTAALSTFNLLPTGSDRMRRQEMMTLVLSARGNVTDSHSDDPDGSNHCFVGRKLWLAWDTFEGHDAGFQDCSRDLVHDHARFNLAGFARLRSACWWTVGPSQTLFLPGRLTHRVITLEPYMGIGSFYCTPASCLENLSRWYANGALWSLDDRHEENDGLVDEIAASMTRRLGRLRKASLKTQQRWGVDFASDALAGWARRVPAAERRALSKNPRFASLLATMKSVAEPELAR